MILGIKLFYVIILCQQVLYVAAYVMLFACTTLFSLCFSNHEP